MLHLKSVVNDYSQEFNNGAFHKNWFISRELVESFVKKTRVINCMHPTLSLLKRISLVGSAGRNMSWMDSWSRPSKHAATPPPLYLLPGGESVPYCHSCGRVIGSRKAQTSKGSKEVVKYCSDRCRHQKPNARDRNIEKTFVLLLNGEDPSAYFQGNIVDTAASRNMGEPKR